MIIGLTFGAVISMLAGGTIIMLGDQNERWKIKLAMGLGIFWGASSIAMLLTSTTSDLDSASFWLIMATFAIVITIMLARKLWITREVKWWSD